MTTPSSTAAGGRPRRGPLDSGDVLDIQSAAPGRLSRGRPGAPDGAGTRLRRRTEVRHGRRRSGRPGHWQPWRAVAAWYLWRSTRHPASGATMKTTFSRIRAADRRAGGERIEALRYRAGRLGGRYRRGDRQRLQRRARR
jgi:hypothetical protein